MPSRLAYSFNFSPIRYWFVGFNVSPGISLVKSYDIRALSDHVMFLVQLVNFAIRIPAGFQTSQLIYLFAKYVFLKIKI